MKLSRWGLLMSVLLVSAALVQGCGYRFVRTSEIRARDDQIAELEELNRRQAANLREEEDRADRMRTELEAARSRMQEIIEERDRRLAERDRYIDVQTDMLASLQDALDELKERERETDELAERLRGIGIVDDVMQYDETGGVLVRLKSDIMFDPGQAEIKENAREELGRVAQQLKEVMDQNPDLELRVAGYTDTDPIRVSPWDSNMQLSGARALAVLKYLSENTMQEPRMHFAGYGEHRPIVRDGSEDKAASRRVELLLIAGTEESARQAIERIMDTVPEDSEAPSPIPQPRSTQPPTK